MKIHVLMGATDYEGSSPISAYASLSDAELAALACNKYLESAPRMPKDYVENDTASDAYDEEVAKWRANHPAGQWYHDRFFILTLVVK